MVALVLCLAFNRAKVAAPLSIWRRYLVYVALLAASVPTVLNMAWNASWLKHGGSPHGMGADQAFGKVSDHFWFGRSSLLQS
jgi:hypothetical protein